MAKRVHQSLDNLTEQLQGLSLDLDYWTLNAQRLASHKVSERFIGARQFRLVLSVAGEIPIQSVIDTGVIPALVRSAADTSDVNLQFEAAWALTNIASGTPQQTQTVVDAGGISIFVQLLTHPQQDIREQGIWGLGNLAGDRPQFRDAILKVPNIISIFLQAVDGTNIYTTATAVWAISNLCRGKPRPSLSLVIGFLPYIVKIISTYSSLRVSQIARNCRSDELNKTRNMLSDACWALDGVSETTEGVAAIVSSGALPYIVALLTHPDFAVQRPALRVAGQIVTGNSQQTQALIQTGGVPILRNLLLSPKKCIRKDVCWAFSNLAAGTTAQVQSLLDCGVTAALVNIYTSDSDMEVRQEAAWAICNACTTQSADQMTVLLRDGCLPVVVESLLLAEGRMAEVALEAVESILLFGSRYTPNPCAEMFAVHGLPGVLNSLQQTQAQLGYHIWRRTTRLLERFSI